MISNKIYDVLKYAGLVACPAIATFVGAVGPLWDWPNVDAIVKTINAAGVLIGALVVVSNASYKANNGIGGDGGNDDETDASADDGE
ncbi:phage holin [Galactobacillus timonensis]|uniref:phage holin n=1 Tax=Galactobacillus timonensis TaxID=2041840 RepID=UPI000C8184CA|nr:phage holin [Galactobacillus timonensis]